MLSIYLNSFTFDFNGVKVQHLSFQSTHELVNQTLEAGPVSSLVHALLKIPVNKKVF